MAERQVKKDYATVRLLNRVLQLYFVADLTQIEISQRLGISTTKVNRLLQYAQRHEMVKFTIHTQYQDLFDLETELEGRFGIREAVVTPSNPAEGSAISQTLVEAGAHELLQQLKDGDVIAIGGGTTIHALVDAIRPERTYQVAVVPVVGGVQGQVTTDVNYLASLLASRLGGKAYQLHAPAFVETPGHRAALIDIGPIKEILDIARHASIALLGIGTVDPETSRFVQFTALSSSEMNQINIEYQGVGEILACVYNLAGQPCAEQYAARVIGLTLQELVQIPIRIGIAGSAAKALPIVGALRGGYFTTILIDEPAARGATEIGQTPASLQDGQE